MFLAVVASAVVVNNRAVPVYRASARILVETDNLNALEGRDFYAVVRSMETELAIMRSRQLAKRTIAALGLAAEAEWAPPVPTVPSGWEPMWSAIRSFSATSFGIGRVPTPAAEPRNGIASGTGEATQSGETLAEARRVAQFLAGLSVSYPEGSSGAIINVDYQSSDAALTARFVNAHAQEYINHSIERRFTAVDELTTWLSDQLAKQQVRVAASNEALARFKEANTLTTIDGASPTVVRLTELAASLTRTQAERLEKEAIYTQALAFRGDAESFDRLLIASAPTLASGQAELNELRSTYTEKSATLRDRHPEMVALGEEIESLAAKLQDDRDRVLEQLGQAVSTSQGTEARLSEELDRLQAEAADQDRNGVRLSALTREAESDREIYDLLIQRSRENEVASERNPIRARILDLALAPTAPVSPNRQQTFLRGVVGGLVLAIAVVFGLERLDNRLRTPHELQESLGLPLIGLLPAVPTKDNVGPLLAVDGKLPQFAEELRHIRTSVLFSFSGDTPRSLVVTSSTPNEGKTIVSCNLAAALAQTGERVLVVDADMRRPSVDGVLALSPGPGLSNLLVGQAKPSQVLQQTSVDNLWALQAGHPPPNPSELLGSPAFSKLLRELERHFSWIIIDTPPVITVTDACVLGNVVSGILFVVGSDQVDRRVASLAVAKLRAARGTLIGGVLNHVSFNRHRHYYGEYTAAYGKQSSAYYAATPPEPGDPHWS